MVCNVVVDNNCAAKKKVFPIGGPGALPNFLPLTLHGAGEKKNGVGAGGRAPARVGVCTFCSVRFVPVLRDTGPAGTVQHLPSREGTTSGSFRRKLLRHLSFLLFSSVLFGSD